MAAAKQYRTIIGIVQFDVRDGEAAGKKVRNFVVNQAGFGAQAVRVYATLWPEHAAFELSKNDVVIFEGAYSSTQKQQDDGSATTYHNVSVSRIAKLATADAGSDSAVEVVGSDVDEDDIPF